MILRILAEIYWASRQATQKITSAGKFLSQPNQQKWLYTTYLCSYLYSSLLVVMCIYATLSCKIVDEQDANKTDTATMFTSNYCRDNTTEIQLRGNIITIGIMLGDLFV